MKQLMLRIMQNRTVGIGYVFTALFINAGNAAAYLFQMLLGRTLDVASFGAFNALFSGIMVITAPAAVLPLVVAQAMLTTRGEGEAKRLLVVMLTAGVALSLGLFAIGCGVVAFVPSVSFSLSTSSIVAVFIIILFSCLHPVTVGALQARSRYILAALVVGGNPLLRFVFGVVLVFVITLGFDGAIWAIALPVVVTFGLGVYYLRSLLRTAASKLTDATKSVLVQAGWRQVISITLLTTLGNVDVVIARMVLPDHTAGLYAGAAIISRIGLLLPAALATMVFAESARSKDQTRVVPAGLLLTGVLAIGVALVFVLFGGLLTSLLFGDAYVESGGILQMVGPAMAMLSMTQAIAMQLSGRDRYGYMVLLILATLAIAGLPYFLVQDADSLGMLVLSINAANFAAMCVLFLVTFRSDYRKQPVF